MNLLLRWIAEHKIGFAFILAALAAVSGGISLVVQTLAPPPSPTVRPFGNNKEWIVVEDMTYRIGDTDERIVVPAGFVTDFASIPQFLWSFGLTPHGQYSRAAVIHDFLYWSQSCTRSQSDRLLLVAMKESNVGTFDEWAVYTGVDQFGNGPWDTNRTEREQYLPRVVPDGMRRPADPNMSWPEYRKILAVRGVTDPPFEAAPAYCKFGDADNVRSSRMQ